MYIPCCTYHVVGQGMKQTWRRLYGYRITSQKGGSEDELRKRKTFFAIIDKYQVRSGGISFNYHIMCGVLSTQ